MNTLRTLTSAFTLGCLLSLPVGAQTWSFSAAAAIPDAKRSGGAVKTRPFFDQHRGAGVQFLAGVAGTAVLYLPVVFPTDTELLWMSFKVEGVPGQNNVRAEIYRQPARGGAPVNVGAISATNYPCPGVVAWSTNLRAQHKVDNYHNTYFVRLQLTKDSMAAANPAVYQVTLGIAPGPQPRPVECIPTPFDMAR
jgi:hypothetical protein